MVDNHSMELEWLYIDAPIEEMFDLVEGKKCTVSMLI